MTQAIADGRPKTKLFDVPFRMEMSGFARHEGSLPLMGDLGTLWPLLAWDRARARATNRCSIGAATWPSGRPARRASPS